MTKPPTSIDISKAAPEIQRLAEEVHASMQPRRIQRDGETIAVVMPVASKRTGKPVGPDASEAVTTRERVGTTLTLPPPPSPEEIARRQAVMQRILANQARRNIAPVTSTELVREVREEASHTYDGQR
jgi:hypothetical protein